MSIPRDSPETMARVHVGDSRRHLPGSGEMEQDEKDPTRGLPREPNHAGDLWETARNWVKKRVILKLWGEGRGRGGGLVNPSSPHSRAEKASVPRETLEQRDTHVGSWKLGWNALERSSHRDPGRTAAAAPT